MTPNAITKPTVVQGDEGVILEKDRRLSESLLWTIQRRFFEEQGSEAWRQNTVPHYITSNPFVANSYAKMVLGFLRDCWNANLIDLSQPVYLIELGSGQGRLAYHFLKKFLVMLERSPLKAIPIKYVMTDFAGATIEFWRSHPRLQPYLASGQLDFARFDAASPQDLVLLHSGRILTPATVKNPVILVANYFFDGIPQDCFRVQNGQLYENQVTLTAPQPAPDPTEPGLLDQLMLTYRQAPVSTEYYPEPEFNQILRDYTERFTDTTFVFPNAGLRCLRYFQELSRGRLLLLSADKGYCREESLLNRGEPDLAFHGSFSMMVNYHAISQYVTNQGGWAFQSSHQHAHLDVQAFLWNELSFEAMETGLAFLEAVEKGGPDDFFALKKGVEKNYQDLSLEQCLAYLRLSGWDSNIFLGLFPTLMGEAGDLSASWRWELFQALEQVWDNYFPLGENKDLPFWMGMLLYEIDYYPAALEYFQHSIELYGPDPAVLYNMAMCHYGLDQFKEALELLNQVIELDSANEEAVSMREQIQGEIQLTPPGTWG
ncbi:MAG TPA: tetratricopeptide repeat protein [Bacillota bacterium]|nr:tetratricopeptide repeat protein [Bacillota bacterium]